MAIIVYVDAVWHTIHMATKTCYALRIRGAQHEVVLFNKLCSQWVSNIISGIELHISNTYVGLAS